MRNGLPVAKRAILSAAITALVMWVLLYAPTPYLVYEPGIAIPVQDMIEADTEASEHSDQGQFLLTAVKLTEPNFWNVLAAGIDRDRDVYLKSDVFGGVTQRQYAKRLTVIMEGSQNDAIEAAYRYLHLAYEVETKAIVVTDVKRIGDKPVSSLRPGDKLLGLSEGDDFLNVGDAAQKVFSALAGLKDNGIISIKAEREKKPFLVQLAKPKSQEAEQSGEAYLAALLGVAGFTELRAIEPQEQEHRLAIAAGEIGGPSAGLVFALGAVDLLTEGSLAGSATIAATGTIDGDGKVGAIGGIRQKVVATSREQAGLFLVPKANEKEARAKAEAIGTDMKVQGVETLQEAIEAIASYNGSR
ncbi:S16 family serine protease [Paenibacillus sp. GCM10027627]|uniref:S16 family serine protease n=1 Tax=unclassified Paenibacillus TaxID=185978 RepID=UPI003639ABA9